MTRRPLPFSVVHELEGWTLFWSHLSTSGASDGLDALRTETAEVARGRFADNKALAADPTVAALRRLFKAAGCDPSRYRPSSEALLRRLIRGDDMPAIHPLVDLNNCLSAELAVPCCVMRPGTFGERLRLRSGEEGESYISLRGPFKLQGKPVLSDENGPLDTPITGNSKVKVEADTREAWLVAYLPSETLDRERVVAVLERLAGRCGAELRHVAFSAG